MRQLSEPAGHRARTRELKPWEDAFLGERKLYTTIVFWQCTVALLWALTSVFIVSKKLYLHSPTSFLFLGIVVLAVFIIYRTAAFMSRGVRTRAILRQQQDMEEYEVSLRKAKTQTIYYVTTMLAIGLFFNVLLVWI